MYKVVAKHKHFIMSERRFGGPSGGKSIVATYNETFPGLADIFVEALKEFNAIKLKGIKRDEYKAYRQKTITEAVEAFIADDYDLERLQAQGYDFNEYVELAIHSHWLNLHNRIKRFQRKADLNRFNYFVTFTYDDDKHNEESFRKSLKKCLNNMHSRRGWLIAGKFERSPEANRLHFHALIYVPEGEMVGALYEDDSYNVKHYRRENRTLNTFFGAQFGRADFVDISEENIYLSTIKNYITKYIYKEDNEKMFYSRGIATYIETDLPLEEYIFCVANAIAQSYYLGDNSFYCDMETNRYLMYDLDLMCTHNRIHLRV